MMKIRLHLFIEVLFLIAVLQSCKNREVEIQSNQLLFCVNHDMQTKICSVKKNCKPLMDNFISSEYLCSPKADLTRFKLEHVRECQVNDQVGSGILIKITGESVNKDYSVEKLLEVTKYDSFPDMVLVRAKYYNTGKRIMPISGWVNNRYRILSKDDKPGFWSFQPSSSSERADWILPVDSIFHKRNFMGMNNTDYGGGIPVVDLWRRDCGVAIGLVELKPELISLAVEKDRYEHFATIRNEYDYPENIDFKPGDSICTYTSFVSIHEGDFFTSLKVYSAFMQARGLKFVPEENSAFEPEWCAWGYGRKFTVSEIEGTLEKVKELGFKWVDIDDGYQERVGDWDVLSSKFSNSSNVMRKLVDKIHSLGLKAKIWWAPLAVDPKSDLLKTNPDLLLWTKDGAPQFITWWNCYYTSPAYLKTIDNTKDNIRTFFKDWNFDGLKMDGQHLNCVPPDYNPNHHLAYPEESNEKLDDYFEMIYKTAISYKPNAVIQLCPCGDAMSFYNIPFINQAVASDPTSSWQIRLKGKTYKAIRPGLAYYGDHVELSDSASDFASQIGVGAIPGSKFTWPKDDPSSTEHFVLTSRKEEIWQKWISIYNSHYLSKGNYLGGLYDIGYDKPETHVIQKGDTLFYAFYANKWNGVLSFRGLNENKKQFTVFDYVNRKVIGTIHSSNPELEVSFKKNLLVAVY